MISFDQNAGWITMFIPPFRSLEPLVFRWDGDLVGRWGEKGEGTTVGHDCFNLFPTGVQGSPASTGRLIRIGLSGPYHL